MNDKVPSKITGFFITVIGTGILLRLCAVIVDTVFFTNSKFKTVQYENYGLIVFVVSLLVGITWLLRVKDITKE